QGHPVEVGNGLQRWGAETADVGERPCQQRHRWPCVPVGLDRKAWRPGLKQRNGERLRCDEFAQAARRGAPGIGIGGLDAKLEKCHVGWRLTGCGRPDGAVILVSAAARKRRAPSKRAIWAFLLMAWALLAPALAQIFPERTSKIIVPQSPGGGFDMP